MDSILTNNYKISFSKLFIFLYFNYSPKDWVFPSLDHIKLFEELDPEN